MLRRVITYHLAFLLLLTNIGVPVFTHVCLGHGKSWTSAFVPIHRSCASETLGAPETCCAKIKACCSSSNKSSPCCDNTISFEQSDVDLINAPVEEINLSEVYPQHFFGAEWLLNSEFSAQVSFQSHAPPLPSQGIRVFLLHRVIRC